MATDKTQKSIRIENEALKTVEKILKSEKRTDSVIIVWEPEKPQNLYGDEDVLPEEIQEIIETLRQYNRVKKTDYRIIILPTFSANEFNSFSDYVRYAIDALNAFFEGGMDKSLIDKLKYWRFMKKKK